MMTRTLSLLVLVLCLCVSGCAKRSSDGKPDTPSSDGTWETRTEAFTPEQEYYLGRGVAATLLSQYRALDTPAANDYLNLLGQSLAQHSTMPNTFGGYHFLLLESQEINAFAAPGGLILVTRGLVQCTNNEDELAAVLAHEIAHVQLRHGVGSLKAGRKADAAGTAAGAGAGAVAGAVVLRFFLGSLGDAISLAAGGAGGGVSMGALYQLSISDIVKTMAADGYSREAEFAADQGALVILRSAGYSEAALATMLHAINARMVSDSGFGKTHPPPTDRLNALRGVSGEVPADRLNVLEGTSGDKVPANPVRQKRYQVALADVK